MRFSLLLLLSAWPGISLAQDARLIRRLEPAAALAVQAQLDSAAAEGLPGEPLVQKALEGRSKGADAGRIVGAVRALRIALGQARGALGTDARTADLVAGANALRAGIPARSLIALRRERAGPLNVPLDVMTDLVARGVEPDAASSAVEQLVRTGRNDGELIRLREQIDQDIRSGLDPRAALERRLAGVPAAGPPVPP